MSANLVANCVQLADRLGSRQIAIMPQAELTLLNRTLGRLRRALRDAAGTARLRVTGQLRPDLPADDAIRIRRQIDACLEARGGEVSARARAADLAHTYLQLSPAGRVRFFRLLARDYEVDRGFVEQTIGRWQAAGSSDSSLLKAESELRAALLPPRVKLLTQFNAVPEGVKFLVDLRGDLLPLARRHRALRSVDADLEQLLGSWFDIGFLELKRITWGAPASLLEKLIAYEAVHEIRSWADLKNRLDSDRRCYAFFHPRMPEEPLIFVEVALVAGMTPSIQALLDESAPAMPPEDADTAIFYSISNCQQGLAGISFGNFLIKRVVDDLRRDLPNLKTFATLSPIPGFRGWVQSRHQADSVGFSDAAEAQAVGALVPTAASPTEALMQVLERPDWNMDPPAAAALEGPLRRLCARYLASEKVDGRALDRVCHFHLSNGARIERINWLGDVSPKGLAQSAGMMVNYRYKLDEIEANHEAYTSDGTVALAGAVRRLLKS